MCNPSRSRRSLKHGSQPRATYINYVYRAMRRLTTFRSTTDRIYDGGPIRLRYNIYNIIINIIYIVIWGTAVAQQLKCCATNRKVAGSIPDGVIGIFH